MTQKTKKWLIFGGLAVVVLIIVLTAVLVKFLTTKLEDSQRRAGEAVYSEASNVYEPDEVSSITIEDAANNITVRPSKDGKVRFVRQESELDCYICQQGENGELNISHSREWWLLSGSGSLTAINVVLELPEDYKGGLRVESASSSVYINELSFTNLSVSLASGKADVSDTACSALSVSGASTNCELKNVAVSELDVEVVSGWVDIENVAAADAEIKTTSGEVKLDRLASSKLNVKTVSGAVEGTLVGAMDDFSIDYETVSGWCNLPRTSGKDNSLFVETTSGNINVTFVE